MKITISISIVLTVMLITGCSHRVKPTPPPPPVIKKVERAELTFPYLKPLKLTPIKGEFKVGYTPDKSYFIMKYSEYTKYLVNNRLIANRLNELRRRLNAYRHYYSKKGGKK